MTPEKLVYYSKQDRWLMMMLGAVVAFEIGVGVILLVKVPIVWLAMVSFAVAGFIAWLLATTCYVVDDERLVVRSGPLKWTIRLDEIESVVPTHDPRSSPALSLDRLRINYRRRGKLRSILISPADKKGFLRVMAAIAPRTSRDEIT